MGFVKGGSRPSLIAGVGLGASYGLAGMVLLAVKLLFTVALMIPNRLPPQGEQGLRLRACAWEQCHPARCGNKQVYQNKFQGSCAAWSLRYGLTGDVVLPQEVQGVQLRRLREPSRFGPPTKLSSPLSIRDIFDDQVSRNSRECTKSQLYSIL